MTAQLDLATQVLDLVRAEVGAAAEAEVTVRRVDSALTRFANSFIHQNVADDTTTVTLRLHVDGRTASASTTLTSTDGLRDLVARTVSAARLSPEDPHWPGLTPATPLAGEGNVDEATAAATPAERAQRVRAFVDAAGGLETAGYCRTSSWRVAFANSAGQAVTTATTEAAMDGIVRHDGADGVARQASVRLADLDGATLGARAAAKARAAADPVELPPGRYEVVLEPNAVADLLTNLSFYGFNGRIVAERRSFVELGAAQMDPSVTIVDDPFAPGRPGLAFDLEGTPRQRLVLVDAGTTVAVAHDRRTAAQMGGGTTSTGHAVDFRGGGPLALNLGMLPSGGAAGADAPELVDPAAAALIAGVGRGLLVSDLWYTRVLDPKTLVVTGLTRNGVWLVEDGQIVGPVRNLRFTQSYPQALGPGAVRAVGPVASLVPTGWGVMWWSAPALHLASWNFTGGASG